MHSRHHELVVFGATGFTGRQAVSYLAPRARDLGLRWAIAGRDGYKLGELAESSGGLRPEIVIADVTDPRSLKRVCGEAEAVISFVGPHGPLGEGLAEQCIITGTHYADLCGENDVIADRVVRLHAPAREAGIKLIPACGYECVPFDIAVLGLDRAFRAVDGSRVEEVVAEVSFLFHRSPLRFGHGNSGGTIDTVARLADTGDLTDMSRFATATGFLGAAESATVELEACRSPGGDWLGPLIPTPFLNPAMVHLTAVRLAEGADGYSSALRYREMLNASASFGSHPLGGFVAKGSSSMLRGIAAMSQGRRSLGSRATVAVLKAIAPKSGHGPSLRSLDAVDYRIDVRALSTSALAARGIVCGVGHPGYRSAANILVEAGIALARDGELPQRAGVLTPASGLGMEFIEALENAEVSFDFSVAGQPSPSDGQAASAAREGG
jgi:short subunit dehydrogenase-like uncharacterized protein